MADMNAHEHEDAPDDPRGPRDRPRALQPLLAIAALLPLAAVVGILVTGPEAPSAPVQRASVTSEAGTSTAVCEGPLDVPEDVVATSQSADAALAVELPLDRIGISAVAVERDSSLLFGTVSVSETRRGEDGGARVPGIVALDAAGEDMEGTAGSGDVGFGMLTLRNRTEGPVLESTASDGSRPVADAVQSTVTRTGDYRSLVVARCGTPVTEASFLGVSTTTGSSAELVLRNASTRPATASIQVMTTDGAASMAGRSQVVVAAGEEQTVLLESIVPGEDVIGVDVTVLGAPLAMHLQTTERDGLTPGGAEILSPLGAASDEIVLPGVETAGSPAVVTLQNPGRTDATASIRVADEDGEIAEAALDGIEVPAESVVQVPLDGLADGVRTVLVDADEDLRAVARSERTGADLEGETIGSPVDFTLVTPAAPIGTSAVSALPAGGAFGSLSLYSDTATAVTVIPLAADGTAGEPVEVQVAEGAQASLADTALKIGDAWASSLVIVPDEAGAVSATWTQRVSDGAGGVLLSSIPVESATLGSGGTEVSLAP
ncbi:DUF5719 family protein [Brachybacterium sp. DNPG3]